MATLKFDLTLPAGISVRKLYLTDMERHPVPTSVRSQGDRHARGISGWVELESDAPPPFIVRAFVGSALGELDVAKHVVEINVNNYVGIHPIVYSAVKLTYLDELKKYTDRMINSLMETSYNYVIAEIRERVQTLPVIDTIPEADDEHVDLGDFIRKLNDALELPEIEDLFNLYNKTIIKTGYRGAGFSNVTGLSICFL